MSAARPFDPERLLATLTRNGVRFIVIGGIAGRLWGSPTVTNDLDICYARDRLNLENLASALRKLKARLRGAGDDVPFQIDARALELGDHFTFTTDAGNLDCLGSPRGSAGYDALERTASTLDLGRFNVKVAALEDLIQMKRAAGRAKDLIEVEVLSAVREEMERDRR